MPILLPWAVLLDRELALTGSLSECVSPAVVLCGEITDPLGGEVTGGRAWRRSAQPHILYQFLSAFLVPRECSQPLHGPCTKLYCGT